MMRHDRIESRVPFAAAPQYSATDRIELVKAPALLGRGSSNPQRVMSTFTFVLVFMDALAERGLPVSARLGEKVL